MAGLPDIARDLAEQYHLTLFDSFGIIRFLNNDIIDRLSKGEHVRIDNFGTFKNDWKKGKVRFRPSRTVQIYLQENMPPEAVEYFKDDE